MLGVSDNGEIIGINTGRVQGLKKELVNALNNPQLLNPPVYIIPDEVEIDGKVVLHIHIPESSQVIVLRGNI